MQVGVLCHDYWHPGTTIRQGLEPLAAEGFVFDFIENAAACTQEWLDRQDVVVIAKANEAYQDGSQPWIDKPLESMLVQFVEQGKGLLALHSGTVGWSDEQTMLELIGGVFESHPHACPVTMKLKEEKGSYFENAAGFQVHDEHYFVKTLDERIHVFMTSESEHGIQPAGWVRTQGDGRVCVLTPGHFLEVLLDPGYQSILSRSLNWCKNGSLW